MENLNAETYTCARLNGPRDIRLITLLQGTSDDAISLTIEHTSLDRDPTYEALSYVWGPQSPSYYVQCNEGRLAIGENLRDALLYLRKLDAPRVIWIDRIAINQEDMNERTHQVGLMADIFSSASLVTIWLGTADGYTESAFSLINDLAMQIVAFRRTQNSHCPVEATTTDHPILYPAYEDSIWIAVRSLFQRPWFSRVWTFQEIVFAQNAVFNCGAYSLNWTMFETFFNGLNSWSEGANTDDARLRGRERLLMDIIQARSLLQQPQTHEPGAIQLSLGLLPLLDRARSRQATDPRDKVYALLNVASDARYSDLKADYQKSPLEVYTVTAKWLLRTQKNLGFLSLVEKTDKPDLVSWVPDFRYKDTTNFLQQPRLIVRGSRQTYNASGNSNATIVEGESDYQLTVRGICVGTIVDRTEIPRNLTNNVAIGTRVLDGGEWQLFARNCAVDGAYPATGEPIDLAYDRLRIWDMLPDEEPGSRRRRLSPPTKIPAPQPVSYDGEGDQLIRGDPDGIALKIIMGTTRKRMFKTNTGYMGLGHRSLEIGDKIFVLIGGETPFILRPYRGSLYGFGGESYVHGIMDGEILAHARAKKEGTKSANIKDLAWIEDLGEGPWPFDTDELVLV